MENKDKVMDENLLQDDELTFVTGGGGTKKIGSYVFSQQIDSYGLTIGTAFFVVRNSTDNWYMGVCTNSWEDPELLGVVTNRMHSFSTMVTNGFFHNLKPQTFLDVQVKIYYRCNGMNPTEFCQYLSK